MSKSVLIGVMVLMSISLLGVVGLQLYWITDAIQVKEEQFDRSVHNALSKVVAKLETQEAVSVVKNKIATLREPQPDQIDAATVTPPEPPAPHKPAPAPQPAPAAPAPAAPSGTRSSPVRLSLQQRTPDTLILRDGQRMQHNRRYLVVPAITGSVTAPVTPPTAVAEHRLLLRDRTFFREIHLTDSLLQHGVTAARVNKLSDTLRHLAGRLDSLHILEHLERIVLAQAHANSTEIKSIRVSKDTVFIFNGNPMRISGMQPFQARLQPGLQERHPAPLAAAAPPQPETSRSAIRNATGKPSEKALEIRKLEAKKDKLNEVVEQMVVEYIVKDVPLQERLHLPRLNNLLKTELAEQGIDLDFGFWVVSGSNDTIAAYPVQEAGLVPVPNYKVSLFPNDIYAKSDYLSVYIPGSKAYAIQSLWSMLLLSGGFTLVIIVTFGATIYIIFRQKKLSEMKNDFINNMTHEFKTPIATISLATDAMANPRIYENAEKIRYYNNIIKEENKRMNVQVENVLQIALLEKNEFKMNLQPVDVHALVLRAVERIKLQVEQRSGMITTQLHALHHELHSDEVHLYNAICNLLDNANKYSPAKPDIKLSTQNVAGGIMIAVEDRGLGMSKDIQQRVFDKFYRVPTGNLHNVKGFGLGLSYVKAIVQAHHGTVGLRSELGKGSRFEIFLPFGGES